MAKKITNSEVIADDFLVMPLQKAKEFLVIIKDIESAIKITAKASKDNLGGKNMVGSLEELRKTKKAIEEINVLTEKALKIRTETMRVEAQIREQEKRNAQADEKVINEQIKNKRELLKLEQERIKLENLKRKESDRAAKEERLTNALKVQVKTLQQLQDRNSALIKVRKNLDLTTEEGIKDYRRFTAEIKKNNAVLGQHDAAIGSYVRNVGNYGSAIKGFGTQLLGILGAGSFLSIVQNGIKANAEFSQSMADLKAITGATDEQMKFFEETAIGQAKSLEGSTASASEYTEALKLIASAKPELLENANALKDLTDKALLLSDASGLDLPTAATKLTDAMNQFGASSDQAGKFVDVLAAAAKYGSAEIPQITDALLEFGPVAKSYNISIQESAAAIEGLAEKGIKGTEAGTKLRNVLLALGAAKGLPKEAQESFERVGIDVNILADNSLTLEERLTELSKAGNDEVAMLKIFGKENISAAKTVLAQKDRIAELTEKVDENGVAQEQAATRTGTLSQEWKKLGNAWEATTLEMGRGGQGLAETLKFIRENLDTIINVITKGIKAYLVYKGTMMAVNGVMKANELRTQIAGVLMSKMTRNTEGANVAFKGLNATMKANVIALLVTGVYELADALGVFESRADRLAKQLTDQQALFDKIRGETDKDIEKLNTRFKKIDDSYAKELAALKDNSKEKIALEKKLRDEKIALANKEIKVREQELKSLDYETETTIKSGNKLANNFKDNFLDEQDVRKLREEELEKYREILLNLEVAEIEAGKTTVSTASTVTDAQKSEYDKRLKDEKKYLDDRLKSNDDYQRKLKELEAGNIVDDEQREIKLERLRNKYAQRDIENHFKAEREKINALSPQSATEQEKLKMIEENKLLEAQLLFETEESTQTKINAIRKLFLEQRLEDDKERIERELNEELEILDRALIVEETNLINAGKKQKEIDIELRDSKIENLEKEIIFRKEAGQDIASQELELAKLRREIADDDLRMQQERNQDLIQAAQVLSDELTKIFTDASKKREDIIDKEIEHSQERQDQLREIAERGVLDANQSLAAEERKQAELERKKLEEQKKQKRIELANTAFKAYVGHVDNKDQSPLTSTIRDITALTAFISSLPAFYEGTENTGKGGKLDDKGGFTAILHPNERVMTAQQNKELAGLSNTDVVRIVRESQYIRSNSDDAVNNMKMADKFAIDTAWNSSAMIVDKVDELIVELRNKPVQMVYVDQVTDKLVSEIRKGSNVTRTHYSKPNING